MNLSPVQVFEAQTSHFLSPQQSEDLRLANAYFLELKRDRSGLETVLQVVLQSSQTAALFLACNLLLDFLSE